MTYAEDLDLEARLRLIAADPEPEVPARLFDCVADATSGEDAGSNNAHDLPTGRGRSISTQKRLGALVGLAAALVLTVSGLMLVATLSGPKAAATPFYSDLWSGLAWHEITASGFPGPTQVVSFNGTLYGTVLFDDAKSGIWTSGDGSSWTQLQGAPVLSALTSAGTWLFGYGINDQALWYTPDGMIWKTAKVPFTPSQDLSRIGVHAGQAIMLTDTVGPTGDSSTSPSDMYRSSDGADWQKVTMPADMASALQSSVEVTLDGYLVTGFIVDPKGSGELSGITNTSSYDYKGVYRTWFSDDGVTWTTQGSSAYPDFGGLYAGARGYERIGTPSVHSTDGVHWAKDVDDVSQDMRGQSAISSDGREVVVQSNGPVFYVGMGDGRWQVVRNVGDVVGGLPSPGQTWAVPGGVLYVAGSRVFFGKALTGNVDEPTLGPGTTITAAPYPSMKPRPSVSLSPVTAWSSLGSLQGLPKGPVGADYVVTWAHGYAAVHNPPASGGQMMIWLSTDGKTWTVVPPSVYGTATSAIPVAAGGALILDQSGGGNDMLMTTDGVTWLSVWGGRPPLGDRMVGDARGAIFAVPDPEFQITFNADGVDPDATWRGTTLPNGDVDTVKDVALSGSGFLAVGRAKDSNGSWEPAAWTSTDGVTWVASSAVNSPGDGFTRVYGGREGYLAFSKPLVGGSGAASLWTSADGKSWQPVTSGPLGSDAIYAADGSHIVGCETGAGLACWSSLNGADWTSLAIQGDTSRLVAAGTALRVFPLADGVLFVTPDGAWRAVAGQ
jgi:hypothetical protein